MALGAIEVGDSVQKGLDSFFGFVPNLIAFLVILFVGYIVAKVLKGIVRKALEKMGTDKALHNSDAGQYVERLTPGASPANGISRVVFWIAFAFVLTIAISALKIPAITAFMDNILAYLPNVIAAIAIFVVAAVVAGAAGGAAAKLMGDTPTGKLVGSIVPTIVLVIGMFMVLNQLKIAEEIVTITFAVLMGSLGLGMALAFGLGGRQVAADLLSDAVDKGRENKERVKRDFDTGKERAKDQAGQAQQKVQAQAGDGSTSTAQRPSNQ